MCWQAAVKTALRMNDAPFTMSIYEEAGDVYFKGHKNRMASVPFYRVCGFYLYLIILFVGVFIQICSGVFFFSQRNKLFFTFFKDGSLPFARSINDIHSEFRLLSKLTELLMSHGDQEEALQYATLAAQIANKTGTNPFYNSYLSL